MTLQYYIFQVRRTCIDLGLAKGQNNKNLQFDSLKYIIFIFKTPWKKFSCYKIYKIFTHDKLSHWIFFPLHVHGQNKQ